MQNSVLFIFLIVFIPTVTCAQDNKKYFSVENSTKFDKIDLTLSATSGSYKITPFSHSNLVNIYSTHQDQNIIPLFKTYDQNSTRYVDLNFKEENFAGISQTIGSKVFKGSEKPKNWEVLLSRQKTLTLNLHYVIGDAEVDLSGLPVEKLKINSGSANVSIGYQTGKKNPILMDTMKVKVDLGTVVVNRVDLSQARTLVADVGFGRLTLEYGEDLHSQSNINASVGAGSLQILLPEKNIPVIIHLNNSPLCNVKLDKSFHKIGKNVFANANYHPDASNLLTFNLDVAMGSISFVRTK
jgi:hypothetical protein